MAQPERTPFLDVLPGLSDHPDFIDIASEFRQHIGLSLARFWAITAVQGIAAAESDKHFVFPIDVEDKIGSIALNLWARSMLITLERARHDSLANLDQPIGWGVTARWDKPILDFGGHRGPVLRPRLFQSQAEPAQLFWHIRHALAARKLSTSAGVACMAQLLSPLASIFFATTSLPTRSSIRWRLSNDGRYHAQLSAPTLPTENQVTVMLALMAPWAALWCNRPLHGVVDREAVRGGGLGEVGDELAQQQLDTLELVAQRPSHQQIVTEMIGEAAHVVTCGHGRMIMRSRA